MKITVTREGAKITLETTAGARFPMHDLIQDLEKATIQELLNECDGVKQHVADEMMLNRTTLVEKCRRYGFLFQG